MKPLFKGQKMTYKQSKKEIEKGDIPKEKSLGDLKHELKMKQDSNAINNKINKRRSRDKVAKKSRQLNYKN